MLRSSWAEPLARMKRNVLSEETICSGGSHVYRGGFIGTTSSPEPGSSHAQSDAASLLSNPSETM